jgi:hypothetical protein
MSDLSFVVRFVVGEDDDLDAATTFVVVLSMQQFRMLLVLAYWLAFTNDRVANLVIPYSHPWPKLISADIKFLMHLQGF